MSGTSGPVFEGLRGEVVVGREKRKSWRGLGPSMVLKLFREGHRIWQPRWPSCIDVPSTSPKGFEGGALADGKVAPCALALTTAARLFLSTGFVSLQPPLSATYVPVYAAVYED